MTEDPIQRLLRQADAAAGAPGVQPDLAGRVQRLAGRRRRRAVGGWAAAAGIALTVGLAAWLWGGGGQRPPRQIASPTAPDAVPAGGNGDSDRAIAQRTPRPAAADEPADEVGLLRAEIARLRVEADSRMAVVQRMLALERRRRAGPRTATYLARSDPAEEVRQQMDQAALVMVYQADRMRRVLDLQAPAMQMYRRAAELFGQTHWGGVARQRLPN